MFPLKNKKTTNNIFPALFFHIETRQIPLHLLLLKAPFLVRIFRIFLGQCAAPFLVRIFRIFLGQCAAPFLVRIFRIFLGQCAAPAVVVQETFNQC